MARRTSLPWWPLGAVVALLALGGGPGCVLPELNLEGKGCDPLDPNGPCLAGFVCVGEVCVRGAMDATVIPGSDANTPDGGADPRDAGFDSGPADAEPLDAEDPADTGTPMDAEPMDADRDAGDPMDAEPMDAVSPDADVDAGPPAMACVVDSNCNPPSTVCRGGFCERGCNAGGPACTGVLNCDMRTGHCFNRGSTCVLDADCGLGPPTGVCLAGQCEYGCSVRGNTQCQGDRMCMPSGFCAVSPACAMDSDCGRPDFVCQASTCVRRCDEPNANQCLGASSCNQTSGKCEGAFQVGADCTSDAQCISGRCVTVTSPTMQQFCARACGATSDCPLDHSCLPIDGAKTCVRENVFSPRPQMDTPSGGVCANPGNTCQSLICLATECIERCTTDDHCGAYDNSCVTETVSGRAGTTYIQQCGAPIGATRHGAVCPNDDNSLCVSGVCNRYYNRCEEGCCNDGECGVNESCLVYDLDFDSPHTTCQPRSGTAGNLTLGQACSQASDCDTENCAPRDPNNLGGAKSCTTHCCTDADCGAYPGGARCAPMPAAGVGARVNYCVPLVP